MGARNEQILFRFRAVFGGRDIFPWDGGLMALSDYQSRNNINMLGGYQFIKGNITIFRPPYGKKPIFKSAVNMKHQRELVFLIGTMTLPGMILEWSSSKRMKRTGSQHGCV